jgi:hypothetical protein
MLREAKAVRAARVERNKTIQQEIDFRDLLIDRINDPSLAAQLKKERNEAIAQALRVPAFTLVENIPDDDED